MGAHSCPHCDSSEEQYNIQFDAWYCRPCGVWIEDECGGEDCEFCGERPERPPRAHRPPLS